MKRNPTIITAFFVILSSAAVLSSFAGDQTHKENKYVSCAVSLQEHSVRAGSTAHLLISFKLQKGIHVNAKPPLQVSFDSTSFIAKVDSLILPTSKSKELLETSKPVKVPFQLSRQIPSGSLKLNGTLTYFYCSDAEGWCSKFKQPFEVTMTITK